MLISQEWLFSDILLTRAKSNVQSGSQGTRFESANCCSSDYDPKSERKDLFSKIGNFTQTDTGYPSQFEQTARTMSLVQYIQYNPCDQGSHMLASQV